MFIPANNTPEADKKIKLSVLQKVGILLLVTSLALYSGYQFIQFDQLYSLMFCLKVGAVFGMWLLVLLLILEKIKNKKLVQILLGVFTLILMILNDDF